MAVRPVPEGYHSVTPYLVIQGAAAALEFYKKVFGAQETMSFPGPDGKVGHAEIRIGDSAIMLADEFPQMGIKGPQSLGGSAVSILLYVPDVDTVVANAVAAGAKLIRPLQDQFYGDRSGTIVDPFGHIWNISTHKEDVSPEEMQRRASAPS